ncbi:glycosyltransferase family 4 protein [Flavobacterium adhaerens]|uniref:glycosyltransferase family 4 protein n=1 Tax=Flavobacterium adhaerens TaxID=3149043 RepID=UPI0032B3FDF0
MKNLLYIGNKLSRHGVTPTTIETLGPLLEFEGFNVVYSSSQKNQILRLVAMLFCVLKNSKVDAVLIDTYSTTNFWYAFLVSQLCRLLRLKYIPILHGGNLSSRLRTNPKLCGMVFNNSYQNVAPSLFLMEKFTDMGYQNLIHISNSIELQNYPFLERNEAKCNLLWVRSFAQIYNPIMAVEVFSLLKKKYPNATLCMVGPDKDGSLYEAKTRAKELNVEVEFPGKLSKKDWITMSKEYSIFINTTHFDNMPVSVMEAMSLGLAIVSTNVGGVPFLLKDEKNALLVPDGNVNEMAYAIFRLIEDPDFFKSIVKNARDKAKEFEWDEVKLKWIAILK